MGPCDVNPAGPIVRVKALELGSKRGSEESGASRFASVLLATQALRCKR